MFISITEYFMIFFIFAVFNSLRMWIIPSLANRRLEAVSYKNIGIVTFGVAGLLLVFAFLGFAQMQWNLKMVFIEQMFKIIPTSKMFLVLALAICGAEMLYSGFQIIQLTPKEIKEEQERFMDEGDRKLFGAETVSRARAGSPQIMRIFQMLLRFLIRTR